MTAIPVIFGEVLFDCFEDGSRVLGGAPFNVAWHLQAFGLSPRLISRVGDDPSGRQIRDLMQGWGMSTAGLQLDSSHPTGKVSVALKDGQPNFDIVADSAYDFIAADALPPMTASLIYHGSLAARNAVSADTLSSLLQQQAAPVFLDVNLRAPWWNKGAVLRQLDHARWVKINDDELDTLIDEGGDLETKAAIMLERHKPTWIIVTRGARGAFSLDDSGQRISVAPAETTAVVDTVGAGDAFAAVCILGLQRQWPLEPTIQRAQQFASQVVGRRGATVNDHAFYASLIAEWGL